MKRLPVAKGYEPLADALDAALDQAQAGKGATRHAQGETFDKQVIMEIDRRLAGQGAGQLFQAVKKIYESRRLPPDRERAELLGAMVYIAARVIALSEGGDR